MLDSIFSDSNYCSWDQISQLEYDEAIVYLDTCASRQYAINTVPMGSIPSIYHHFYILPGALGIVLSNTLLWIALETLVSSKWDMNPPPFPTSKIFELYWLTYFLPYIICILVNWKQAYQHPIFILKMVLLDQYLVSKLLD